jgi:hypothetical protein
MLLEVAPVKRTIFNKRFVARLKVARLKRTIFYERVCGAIKSGASKKNHFSGAFLWRD